MIGGEESTPKPVAKKGGALTVVNSDQIASVVKQIEKKGGSVMNQAMMNEINNTLPQDTQIGKVLETARKIKERAEKEQQ